MSDTKDLLFTPKNGYDRITPAQKQQMEEYSRRYMEFISQCKIEREAVRWTVAAAERAGFTAWEPGRSVRPGDKIYWNNRGKSVMFAVIGRQPLASGVQICAAHIDSPRLDLKPNPLYEDAEMAFFKTHYYGGIKKYQWTAIPLALHGTVVLRDGSNLSVCVGEEADEPVFYVPDLLIHLAQQQMRKPLAEGVTAEQLNVLIGSMPLPDNDGADRVKLQTLQLLNEKYGLCEEDFFSAELTLVPAGKARPVGFDRSMIAAYGHDDRVCAYAAFDPMLSLENPEKTAMCILADKEEIGSFGVSGLQSACFETFLEELCQAQGVSLRRCLGASFCLSADVTNAFDPTFADTCDKQNNAKMNHGVAICKYTGRGGKSGASDASAEVMGYVRHLFADSDVVWQTATLGKVDQGGGGTVAAYMANRNIDTVDAGVPVLSMHAPMEIVGKFDAYMTAKAIEALYRAKE